MIVGVRLFQGRIACFRACSGENWRSISLCRYPPHCCFALKQIPRSPSRMTMPNGFPGPTPYIPPEKAYSISVHLRRPVSVKGWGTWLEGRFHRVTEWDVGGIQIFDMESEPVALRTSGFDSVHVYIPRSVLNRFSDESEQERVRTLQCTPGTRDDVMLHWARMMMPYFDRAIHRSALRSRRDDHVVLRPSCSDLPGPERLSGSCCWRVGCLATRSSDRTTE